MVFEIWKPVVGFVGYYSVSNMGRVRSEKSGKGSVVGRVLCPCLINSGYLTVTLCKDTVHRRFLIHRLVASSFLGDPGDPKLEVNHLDGNKLKNTSDNLEWVTRKQNMGHASKLGLTASGDRHNSRTRPDCVARGDRNGTRTHPECVCRGELNGVAKLSRFDIVKIRSLLKQGLKQRVVAGMFKISQSNVSMINTKTHWAHI